MNEKKSYLIISIADMIFLVLFAQLCFIQGAQLLKDCDTGYHIRAGEYILKTLSIPRNDIFSFHTPPIPWTAHEWLSEVIMAIVHKYAGLTGVVVFFAFIIALTYYLLFRVIRIDKGNILLAVLMILFVLTSSQIHWLARPHIFTLLLMVIWYYVLDAFQYKDKNLLYCLPLLMLLWVNLHGGFIIGFILLAVYWFDSLLKYFTKIGEEKERAGKKTRYIGYTIIACLSLSLINPFGYHILLFPFNLVNNKYIMDNVMEFLSPNFHDALIFKYLLLTMIFVFGFSRERLNYIELVLVIFFTSMSLYSVRYIPLYAIITAPVILRSTESILSSDTKISRFFKRRAAVISSIDSRAKGVLWPIAGVIIIVAWASSGKLVYSFDPKYKPVAAVEFLMKQPIQGNMFDNDEFGDYIIYAAWPKYKVFFDGRSDMYGKDKMKEYGRITSFETGWEKILEKYDMTWIVFDADSALSRFLLTQHDWKLIYADNVANIFVKNIPEYQRLIQKYPDVRPVVNFVKDQK